MQGCDINALADLLGHKDLRMTRRYAHLSQDYLSEKVAALDTVFGFLSPRSVPKEKELIEGSALIN